jgi:hypothetical protein
MIELTQHALERIASAVGGIFQRIGWSRQSRKDPDGTEVLRCYVRGWNDPYPAALYSGRLILPPGGPCASNRRWAGSAR